MDDPHANAPDEHPEDHFGPVTRDPWDDPEQTDWPCETVKLDANGAGRVV